MNKLNFTDKVTFKKSKEDKQKDRIGFNKRLPMKKNWEIRFKIMEKNQNKEI